MNGPFGQGQSGGDLRREVDSFSPECPLGFSPVVPMRGQRFARYGLFVQYG